MCAKRICKSNVFNTSALSYSDRSSDSSPLRLRKPLSMKEEGPLESHRDLGALGIHLQEAEHLIGTGEKDISKVRFATLSLLRPWFPECDPDHERAKTFRTWHSRRDVVMLTCSVTAVAIFLINFICTVYFKAKWGQEDDINAIYQGDCSQTSKINTGLHAVINILSTILLGASNMCMKLLAAPTSKEIDKAHERHIWLDIGVPSIRNLKHIRKSRLAVVLALGLSSIALHFL